PPTVRPHPPPCLPFVSLSPPPAAISTLSLHDALPIWPRLAGGARTPPAHMSGVRFRLFVGLVRLPGHAADLAWPAEEAKPYTRQDRKSTRLNSSHDQISYAVFCLKKKNTTPHSIKPYR